MSRLPWVIAAVAGAALVGLVLYTGMGKAGTHPVPRAAVTAERVLPPAAVPPMAGALEAYAAARVVPATLDGLYCHCDCARHLGHRSLLTCFETEHAAHCDICMGEATLAAQLAARGSSLEQIRKAIDARFGG